MHFVILILGVLLVLRVTYGFSSNWLKLAESVTKAEFFRFSSVGRVRCYVSPPCFTNGRLRVLGFVRDEIVVRNASIVAAEKLPEYGSDEEGEGKGLVSKKRKEVSPEECDQVVEGLSSAKAEVKARKLNESVKVEMSVLQRTWVVLGLALRANDYGKSKKLR